MQLEKELNKGLDTVDIDTFDVRDAVWRLVAQEKAEFTPQWDVKLK